MDVQELIKQSESRVFKAVFPDNTNHYDTMFGGKVMSMMDEIAFITATRFTRKKMVTVNSKEVNFDLAIPAGTILELVGKVEKVGNSSITVKVDGFIEEMYSNYREKAVSGLFKLVAIGDNRKPVRVLEDQE